MNPGKYDPCAVVDMHNYLTKVHSYSDQDAAILTVAAVLDDISTTLEFILKEQRQQGGVE